MFRVNTQTDIHVDRRTDMTKLTIPVRNFAIAPKITTKHCGMFHKSHVNEFLFIYLLIFIFLFFSKCFWPQINALQDTYLHQLVTDVTKHELLHFPDVLYSLISEVI